MNLPTLQSPFAVSAVSAIAFAVVGRLWSGYDEAAVSLEPRPVQQPAIAVNAETPAPAASVPKAPPAVQQAERARVRCELQIHELEAAQEIASARLQVELAQADLERYLEAEHPAQQRQLDAACRLAQHRHEQALDQRGYLRRLSKKGYCREKDVQKASVGLSEAEAALEAAEARRTTYLEHTHPRRTLELQGALQEKQRRLEITEEKAELELAQARTRCGEKYAQAAD